MTVNTTPEVKGPATEEKKVKAKSASLWGQIIAAIWCAAWSAFLIIKNIQTIEIKDILFSGLAIAGCFSPVYFNLFMDKIHGIKWGDNELN